jgi:hypothetical protein
MSNVRPVIGKEDEFEGLYTEKFRVLVRGFGEFVQYDRDRVALDIGLHLTMRTGTQRRVSHTRIWFQLKGIHKETLPLGDYQHARDVGVSVLLDHLKFWFASPEPIYLAVYVEAADTFLVEDVREIVYRRWSEDFLSPGTFQDGQQKATVRIHTDTVLTPERVALMQRHQSMRVDGPFFRGRPLGHRLDPLRCSLNKLEPAVYVSLIQRLLEVHDYRVAETLNPAVLFSDNALRNEHVVLTQGRLYNTFEWVPHLFTEIGFGPDDDFRTEGTPQFAHGPIAVCIHGDPQSHPRADSLRAFAGSMRDRDIRQILVFANTDDYAYFGSFFGGCRGTGVECMPQLLSDLAYSLLTTTMVYLEFREVISWKSKNYL